MSLADYEDRVSVMLALRAGRKGARTPEHRSLQGRCFGRLLVLERVPREPGQSTRESYWWVCRCECGDVVSVRAHHLTTGNTKSCGCLHVEVATRQLEALRRRV